MKEPENCPDMHPVQMGRTDPNHVARISKAVALRAYEVYCHLYGPHDKLVTGWCRGGMGTGEYIRFLYAWPFPREEWSDRVQEAEIRISRRD